MPEDTAVEAALRALRHRDLSVRQLRDRLAAKEFTEAEREDAIERLVRTGVLDDVRFAEARARMLAGRGAGDALIRHELDAAGIGAELMDEALAGLEPEAVRAELVVDRRGGGPATARYLSRKGFSDDVVSSVVAGRHGNEIG
jgi:regulatory protein